MAKTIQWFVALIVAYLAGGAGVGVQLMLWYGLLGTDRANQLLRGPRSDAYFFVMLAVAIWLAAYPAGKWAFSAAKRLADRLTTTPERVRDALLARELEQGEFLRVAESEIENGQVDPALWALALVQSRGVEADRKIKYLQLRAKHLAHKSATQQER